MSVEKTESADATEIIARAADLMIEALILLDQAAAAHSAALLDNAIAVLPKFDVVPKSSVADLNVRLGLRHSESRSSIRR